MSEAQRRAADDATLARRGRRPRRAGARPSCTAATWARASGLARRVLSDRTLGRGSRAGGVRPHVARSRAASIRRAGSMRAFLLAQVHGRAVDLLRAESARRAREEREALRSPTVDIDLEREVMQLTEAEAVRARARDALRRRARGDRARVLRRAYLPRGRGAPRTARRHGEEPDPRRTPAAARRADRSGGERMTRSHFDSGRERPRLAARRVRARRARRRRPRARRRVPRARRRPRAPRSTRCARPRRRSRCCPDTPMDAPPELWDAHRAGDRRRIATRPGAGRARPRRSTSSRARRAAAGRDAVDRAGAPRRRRSRSWCSPRRSCRCTDQLDQRSAARADGDGGRVRSGREGRRRARGRAAVGVGRDARPRRAPARRHRLPPRRPPRRRCRRTRRISCGRSPAPRRRRPSCRPACSVRDPSALGFHASGPVHAFAVTVETAGGVVTSQQTPIAQGAVA